MIRCRISSRLSGHPQETRLEVYTREISHLTLGKILRARVSFTGLPITDWYGEFIFFLRMLNNIVGWQLYITMIVQGLRTGAGIRRRPWFG